MAAGFKLLCVVLALTYSAVCGEEFKTKQFSIDIPGDWELVTSSEKHISDTLIWKKYGTGHFPETYGYSFSLKNSSVKYSFPWCNIFVMMSKRIPKWIIPQMDGIKYETNEVGNLPLVEKHKKVFEVSTLYNWSIKQNYHAHNTVMQSLMVYIPTDVGGIQFSFTVQKDSFPKYESTVFNMIKSLRISDDIKYTEKFIEKIPLADRIWYYLQAGFLTFPANLIAFAGVGLVVFALIMKRRK